MRRGRRVTSSHLVLHYMTRPEPLVSRAGFVVGKLAGNSVQRHRVIRQLRHLVAPQLSRLSRPTDLVIRALAGAQGADLQTEVQELMERAGLVA